MKKRTLSLFLSIVLMLSLAIPVTLATEQDKDTSESTFGVGGSGLYERLMNTAHVVEFESVYNAAAVEEKNALTTQQVIGAYNYLNNFWIDSACEALVAKRDTLRASISALPNAAAVCAECGVVGGHIGVCSFNTTTELAMAEEPVVCDMCGQSGGHEVGCFATFAEINKTGYFVSDSVTLYENPTVLPDSTKAFSGDQLPESFTVLYSFPGENGTTWYMLDTENWTHEGWDTNDSVYGYVNAADVTFVIVPSGGDGKTDPDTGVTVWGTFPAGTELKVETAALEDVVAYVPELAGIDNAHAVYDISLLLDGAQWQPGEGEKMVVTMNASGLGVNGDSVLIYHVHPNGDGTADTEVIGPVVIQNGTVTFEISRFSYVLVMNTKTSISGVANFYPVQEYADSRTFPIAGNGYWCILGVYIGVDGSTHILLGQVGNGQFQTNKIAYVEVNGVQYPNTNDASLLDYHNTKITEIKLGETANTAATIIDFSTTTNVTSGLEGFLDINLGTDVVIGEQFDLSLRATTGQEGNSFNIAGTKVELHLEYDLEKTIYAVNDAVKNTDSEVVTAGDWVTFKIVATNEPTSNTDLVDAVLTDSMPACFDPATVQWSADGISWSSTVPTVDTLHPGDSQTFYVKAQIPTDYSVETDTDFTNKAELMVPDMPTAMDDATVTVLAPTVGALTVSKTVQGDDAPAGDKFTFTVNLPDGTYTCSAPFGTLTATGGAGVTFELAHGESITIEDVPAGSYTVTETPKANYTADSATKTAVVVAMSTTNVAFVNTYTAPTGGLTITKTLGGVTTDIPANQTFTFTVAGTALVNGETYSGYVAQNGALTVTITGAGSVTLEDLPLGTYTVTEASLDNYTTKVNGTAGNSGTVTVTSGGQASIAFENTYKRGDLKVSKTVVRGDATQSFPFTFTVNTAGQYSYSISKADGTTATGTIANGGTFNLANDDTITVAGLPVGAVYSVTETTHKDYAVQADGANTNAVTGTMDADGQTHGFINTYIRTSLTISKSGIQDVNQSTIYKVYQLDGNNIYDICTVTIHGNKSVTIDGLTVGATYKVMELTDWSWRYTNTNNPQNKVLTANPAENVVSFANNRTNGKWLSGDNWAVNVFGSTDVNRGDGNEIIKDSTAEN